MRKLIGYLIISVFASFMMTACNTQKPANEVEGAKDRVRKKVQDARDKQEAENPELEQQAEE